MPSTDAPESHTLRTKTVTGVTGVILAGGQGRRCGGQDKGWLTLNRRPLIENMLAQLEPQVDEVLISANRHHDRYAHYGHPVIADQTPDFAGPMAGVCAGLHAARTEWVLFVPVDAAQLPPHFAQRMGDAAQQRGTSTVVAHDGSSIIPVASLIHRTLKNDLENAFAAGRRSLRDWLRGHNAHELRFDPHPAACWSVNTLQELHTLENILRASMSDDR